MPGFGTVMATNIANWLWKRTQMPTPPPVLFIALHIVDPTDAGTGTEMSGGGYARVQLNPDSAVGVNVNWNGVVDPGAGAPLEMTAKATVAYPQASADWNSQLSIGFWGLWDASTNGTFYLSGTITGGVIVRAGNTLQVTGGSPGTFKFTIQ